MPVMSKVERAFCRSASWRRFTGRVVLPWVLGDLTLEGEVLEVGSGSGANARAILERHAEIQLTATDLDPVMVASARRRLGMFGDRVSVSEASVTALPFDDGHFDMVVSLLMLHHVIEWQAALEEIVRVLRPGGTLVGYDLAAERIARAIHVVDRSPHRLITPQALDAGLVAAGFDVVDVRTGAGGTITRFSASTSAAEVPPSSRGNVHRQESLDAP